MCIKKYKLFFLFVLLVGIFFSINYSFSAGKEQKIIIAGNNKIVNKVEKKNDDKETNFKSKKEQYNKNDNSSAVKKKISNDDCFVKFDAEQYLNFNIDDIVYHNMYFLEDDNKFKVFYKTFMIQNDPITQQKEINKNTAENIIRQNHVKLSDQFVKLTSLMYFDDKNWHCKINNKKFDYKMRNEIHKNVSIVKVNKQSILFVLNNTTEDIINKVIDIKKHKEQYYTNFYIVSNKKKKVLMFRLFIGQTIDLETLKISG